MEYGLIFFKNSPNLGDDIQTYATSRLLPRVDYIVERESIDSFYTENGKPIALILAGWFLKNHLNWPPSPFIIPHITSLHLDMAYKLMGETALRNFVIHGYGAEWLIENGPVGCRDEATKEFLLRVGIPAYLSGCLTLTIPKFENTEHHGCICAIDVENSALEIIRKKTKTQIMELSHCIESGMLDFNDRMRIVEDRLRIYQGAKLIVTGRLHAALPALALGTPVLLLFEDRFTARIGTYLSYLNHVRLDDFCSDRQDFDFDDLLPNPDRYLRLRTELLKTCGDFIGKCKGLKNTPTYDIALFKDCIKRTERLKTLMRLRVDKFQRMIPEQSKVAK